MVRPVVEGGSLFSADTSVLDMPYCASIIMFQNFFMNSVAGIAVGSILTQLQCHEPPTVCDVNVSNDVDALRRTSKTVKVF